MNSRRIQPSRESARAEDAATETDSMDGARVNPLPVTRPTLPWLLLAALAVVALTLGGCGAAEGVCAEGEENHGTTCPDGGDGGSFPSGPYGEVEGATLKNMTFTNPDGTSISLEEIRAQGDRRVLLVSTAADWCVACKEEAPALQDLYDSYGCQGLDVLVTIFEKGDSLPSDATDADKWAKTFGTTYNVVADPGFQFGDFYDRAVTPMNMIIDLCTMEIVSIGTGFDRSLVEATITSLL